MFYIRSRHARCSCIAQNGRIERVVSVCIYMRYTSSLAERILTLHNPNTLMPLPLARLCLSDSPRRSSSVVASKPLTHPPPNHPPCIYGAFVFRLQAKQWAHRLHGKCVCACGWVHICMRSTVCGTQKSYGTRYKWRKIQICMYTLRFLCVCEVFHVFLRVNLVL